MIDLFNLPELTFPEGFLWGSGNSAFQIEGNTTNCDWWRACEEGRAAEHCGAAIDHWNRYVEDIGIVKEIGHPCWRFSVEWSRIEPREREFDEAATEHYVDVARRLVEAGIRPIVTLFHFTNPLWFADRGEWHKAENIASFFRYVEHIVPRLSPYATQWAPINEFNFYSGAPTAPGNHEKMANYFRNIFLADAGTYDIIKAHSVAPCASPLAYLTLEPARTCDTADRMMTEYCDWVANGCYLHAIRTGEFVYPFRECEYLPQLKGRADYWGINMYSRDLVDSRKASCRSLPWHHNRLHLVAGKPERAWEFAPDALLRNMDRLRDKPIYITENGMAASDDRFRILYLAAHLAMVRQALDLGLDIRQYLYWSTFDNYEWGSFAPAFGLVAVDRATMTRTIKPSARFFQECIQENGVSGRLVRRHLGEYPSMMGL